MSTQPITLEQYWTIDQVAARLHVTDYCVKKWLVHGRIPRTKAGSRTLVTESHLQEFIRQSTLAANGPQDDDRPM